MQNLQLTYIHFNNIYQHIQWRAETFWRAGAERKKRAHIVHTTVEGTLAHILAPERALEVSFGSRESTWAQFSQVLKASAWTRRPAPPISRNSVETVQNDCQIHVVVFFSDILFIYLLFEWLSFYSLITHNHKHHVSCIYTDYFNYLLLTELTFASLW